MTRIYDTVKLLEMLRVWTVSQLLNYGIPLFNCANDIVRLLRRKRGLVPFGVRPTINQKIACCEVWMSKG